MRQVMAKEHWVLISRDLPHSLSLPQVIMKERTACVTLVLHDKKLS